MPYPECALAAVLVTLLCAGCDSANREVNGRPAVNPIATGEQLSQTDTHEDATTRVPFPPPVAEVSESVPSNLRGNPPTASIDTVRGIVRVRNTGAAWGPGDAWSVTEVFRLGAENDPPEELFGPLIRVGLSPTGAITVVDPQASLVSVFDRSGRFLRSFGRPGRGPGELQFPSAPSWDDEGHLWLAHPFNARYTVFDSLGNLVKTTRRLLQQGISGRHQLVFNATDSFIDQAPGPGESVQFFRIDTAGAIVDTLMRFHYPRQPRGRMGPMPRDFDNHVLYYLSRAQWAVAPDGSIWSAETGALRLVQQNPNGDTIRIVETNHRNGLALDGSTRRRVETELARVEPEFDYTLVRPVVAAIDVLSDGHVIVQIVEEVGVPSELHDVFDPQGRFLGSIRFGFPVSPRGLSAFVGDTILAVSLGDLDVPYVVRAHIQR